MKNVFIHSITTTGQNYSDNAQYLSYFNWVSKGNFYVTGNKTGSTIIYSIIKWRQPFIGNFPVYSGQYLGGFGWIGITNNVKDPCWFAFFENTVNPRRTDNKDARSYSFAVRAVHD